MEDDKKYIFTEEEKKRIKEDAEKYGRHTVGCGTDNKEPFLNETLKKDSPS